MTDRAFRFCVHWIVAASAVFAVQGISWIAIGSFDPFGIYDQLMSNALFDGGPLTQEARGVFGFALVMLGATTAGFFVLFGLIAKYGLLQRQRWTYWTLVAGILTWFVIDSVASVAVGATFNVLLVNLPCLLVIGIPLLILYRSNQWTDKYPLRTVERSDTRVAGRLQN